MPTFVRSAMPLALFRSGSAHAASHSTIAQAKRRTSTFSARSAKRSGSPCTCSSEMALGAASSRAAPAWPGARYHHTSVSRVAVHVQQRDGARRGFLARRACNQFRLGFESLALSDDCLVPGKGLAKIFGRSTSGPGQRSAALAISCQASPKLMWLSEALAHRNMTH